VISPTHRCANQPVMQSKIYNEEPDLGQLESSCQNRIANKPTLGGPSCVFRIGPKVHSYENTKRIQNKTQRVDQCIMGSPGCMSEKTLVRRPDQSPKRREKAEYRPGKLIAKIREKKIGNPCEVPL